MPRYLNDDERECVDADPAGAAVSIGCDLRRGGGELRAVLRGGGQGGALPDRRRRLGDARRPRGDRRVRTQRLTSWAAAGTALRVPRARPLRSFARSPLQPCEAADGPLRQGGRGTDRRR